MLEFFYCNNKRVNKGEPVKIVYGDLLEAFDTVFYNSLLKKAKNWLHWEQDIAPSS